MVVAAQDPLKVDFKNFLFVCWEYLRLPAPTPVQYDIADYLQSDHRRRVVEAFRGVGKSWITVAYAVWRLYCDPQRKILVVSASKNLSDNFTTFALQLIHGMPCLAHLKPKDHQREAKIQFDVGPSNESKDPSVRSVGITGQIAGSRADEIIADDIEIPNNSQTQMMRDKLSESVKEFDAVLKPGGRITYLGTPQCEQSLYNQLPARGYHVRIWPARFPEHKLLEVYGDKLAPYVGQKLAKDHKLVGRATDPKRFGDDDLMEREASYGRSGFALQFMLDTSLSDANRYPLKLSDLIVMSVNPNEGPRRVNWASSPELVCSELPNVGFGGDRLYRPMFIDRESWLPYTGSVLAIDPSGRGKDETGYCVVKMLHGILYVTAWGGFLGGYSPETLTALAKIAKDQQVNRVIIEPNFGDGMFTQLLKPYLQKVYPVTVDDEKRSTGQKERRIIDTLEPVLNGHKLVIDTKLVVEDFRSTQGLPAEQAQKYQGLYQLTRITKDRGALVHDDRLEALSMAVGYWVEQMAKDTDKAVGETKERLIHEALKGFVDHVWSRPSSGSQDQSWMNLN